MGMPDRTDSLPQINELPQRDMEWQPGYTPPGGDARGGQYAPPPGQPGAEQHGPVRPGPGQYGPLRPPYAVPPRPSTPISPTGLPPMGAPRPSGRDRRYVLYIFWLIEILIAIRLILLLMAANPDALFSEIIYAVTEPFVIVFQNVFASPSGQGHQLEAASVLALIVYPLLLWGVLRLLALLRRRATT